MQKITLTLLAVISAILVLAQSPQAFKYQAVVRNSTGDIIANQEVSFRISIRDVSASGTVLYQETHIVMTDAFGHANLEIGNGDPPIIGFIKDIDWGTNEKFLEVELDPLGNIAYVSMGTTQLLAVPYALYSESTGDTSRWRRNIDDLYYLDGKVGIGSISPQYNLDIYGNATGQSRLRLTNPDNSKILLFGSGNDLYNSSITFHDGDALRFMRYDGGFSELMRIQSDGDVGIGTDSPDESALLDLNSNSKGFLPPRLINDQILGMIAPSEGLIVYNIDSQELNLFNGILWVTMCKDTVLMGIGDFLLGGIVAYFLQPGDPGYEGNVQHGLIAAPSDYSIKMQWYNNSWTTTGATGVTIGTGQANTTAIVTTQGMGSYAAQVCDDFDDGTYSDWFLPSIDELALLYMNKSTIDSTAMANGGVAFADGIFWSSTENDTFNARALSYSNGQEYNFGKDIIFHVRAVRAF